MEENYSNSNDRLGRMEEILGTVVDVTKGNSENAAVILAKIQQTERLVTGLSNAVKTLEDANVSIGDRVTTLENHTELSTTQCDALNDLIAKRITSLLNYGSYDYHVYHGEFQRVLRRDAHKMIGVPLNMSKVMKMDFDRYRDFIEAYIPNGGVMTLKEKLSNNLTVRKNKEKYKFLLTN